MAEMNDPVAPWLEAELSREFQPVAAPSELWERIQAAPAPVRKGSSRYALMAIAAAALLTASTAAILRANIGRHHLSDMERLADGDLRALLSHSGGALDFRSADPAAIRAWVKENADVELELPPDTASLSRSVTLVGVKLMKLRGTSVAAIEYCVGDDAGTLLVSKSCDGKFEKTHHVVLRAEGKSGTLSSWNMGSQSYTIAFAGNREPKRACLLCHADLTAVASVF